MLFLQRSYSYFALRNSGFHGEKKNLKYEILNILYDSAVIIFQEKI